MPGDPALSLSEVIVPTGLEEGLGAAESSLLSNAFIGVAAWSGAPMKGEALVVTGGFSRSCMVPANLGRNKGSVKTLGTSWPQR